MRAAVAQFASAMEKVLQENDHKGGWGMENILTLFEKLGREYLELQTAMLAAEEPEEIMDECVDLANFAMMMYDKLQPMQVEKETLG